MVKKVFLIFLLLGAGELVLLGLVFSARLVLAPAASARGFDNLSSRLALRKNFTPALALIAPEQTWRHEKTELESWVRAPAARSPHAVSSLANYFYTQTDTAHPWAAYSQKTQVKGLTFGEQALGQKLLAVALALNRAPQDAELVIAGNRATKFTPHKNGQVLDLRQSRRQTLTALVSAQKNVSLPLSTFAPKVKLGELNHLGILEPLAAGQSDFTGSSNSRINNIRVGAKQFQGLIIKAGEEFSFNQYLGSVDGAHGFLPELVIKPEGTVPEFGGGLCQVSTTAFRAAFFGGLPITARKNHSYAVKYYEWIADDRPRAVGLDATIYPGAQDMKFINDTPGAILIWTWVEGRRLHFDFYGTPDGREVTVDGPHPYDRRTSGAVKSTVSRTVIKNGEKQELTLLSNYVSPNLYPRIYEFPKPLEPAVPETPSEPAPSQIEHNNL